MSELGDTFKAMAEEARKRREREEGPRIANALYQLESIGCKVKQHDAWSFKVQAPNGKRFHYWPWKGWWHGSAQGRGLAKLVRACSTKEPRP